MNLAKVKNTRASKLTTIAISRNTKARLDKNRAPGQCYNGFICQLIDLWEEVKEEKKNNRAGPAGGNQGAVSFNLTTA